MLPIFLEERFQLLLGFAKDPKSHLTARENLAAAKEIVHTMFCIGHLETVEYKAYNSLCTTVGIMIGTAELKRASATRPTTETQPR